MSEDLDSDPPVADVTKLPDPRLSRVPYLDPFDRDSVVLLHGIRLHEWLEKVSPSDRG